VLTAVGLVLYWVSEQQKISQILPNICEYCPVGHNIGSPITQYQYRSNPNGGIFLFDHTEFMLFY